MSSAPTLLVIVDGWGINPNPEANAVAKANTPVFDTLFKNHSRTELITCGERVGLPAGQMGNSEVGHLNIGAGRVVEQELTRINRTIAENALDELSALTKLIEVTKSEPERALHLIGLTSIGGVHSSLEHLKGLISEAVKQGLKRVYVHAITDGRDRPPQAAVEELSDLERFIAEITCGNNSLDIRIASIIGRYFAMDRDKRWERTEKAYRLITEGEGRSYAEPIAALKEARENGEKDEFLEPIIITPPANQRAGLITNGDGLIFFNFRADRMRQIVSAFCRTGFDGFNRNKQLELSAISTLTEYEPDFEVDVLFSPLEINNHLGQVVSRAGLTQLRIAETEKYPHVTYFFSGGKEELLPGEKRILVPSPRDVPTYDFKPEMSAYEVTDKLLNALRNESIQLVVLNYANCDMVGHTGDFDATVKAVETADSCVGKLLEYLQSNGGQAVITSDHGNAEQMIDYATGKPQTAHTTLKVPFFLVGSGYSNVKLRSGGALCDIAPTVLELMQLDVPKEMTGVSLIEHK